MGKLDRADEIATELKKKGILPFEPLLSILIPKIGEDRVVYRRGHVIYARSPLAKALFRKAFGKEFIVVDRDVVENVPKFSDWPLRIVAYKLGIVKDIRELFDDELWRLVGILWMARDERLEKTPMMSSSRIMKMLEDEGFDVLGEKKKRRRKHGLGM